MIYFEHVTQKYPDSDNIVLNDADLHIFPRELCFLTGKSGAGKTTVLKLLLRDLKPTEGAICVNGEKITDLKDREIPAYRRKLGMVFQDYRLIADRTAYENVAIAKIVSGASEREVRRQVATALRMVGLEDKYARYPGQLSGGEQQRVGIARAIVNSPYVILADEPTGNLDQEKAREIMLLLERINQTLGITVLIATHDIDAIKDLKHRNLKIKNGRIVEGDNLWKEFG